jgi:uncharacterized repeat protein (TIGR01451 family)
MSHGIADQTIAANNNSALSDISEDGDTAVFVSVATDLTLASDLNAAADVFLWQADTGSVTLVSHAVGAPLQAAAGRSYAASLNQDGSRVGFRSFADDLVAGFVDGNGGGGDLFVKDISTGSTTLASHTASEPNTSGNDDVVRYVLSADGDSVAFQGGGTDYVPGFDSDGWDNIFLVSASPVLADLSPVITASSDVIDPMDPLTLTLSVENLSAQPATNVHVTGVLPAGALVQALDPGDWTCTQNSFRLYCDRPSLPAFSTSGPATVDVTIPGGGQGTLTHRALVFWYGPDPNLSNNGNEIVLLVGLFSDGFEAGNTSDWSQSVP